MKFGQNLKLIRKSRKISQEELAERLGVSRQSISKWETGENYPSMQNIMCLCTIFKCKINELVHENFVDINFLDEEIKMSVVKFKKNEQKKMKGISKFIYVVSRITKVVSIIGLVISILACIVGTSIVCNTKIDTNEKSAVIFSEKYNYNLDEKNLEFISKDGKKTEITINNEIEKETIGKVLEMSKISLITLTLFIGSSMVIGLLVLFKLVSYLEKLFKNINENDTPFNMDNVLYIKKIALYVLLYLISSDVLAAIAEGIYSLDFNIEIDLANYVIALIVLAISYVFKYGYEIQLDSNGKIYGDDNE